MIAAVAQGQREVDKGKGNVALGRCCQSSSED